MQVKYFREDGSEEIVDLPGDPDRPCAPEHDTEPPARLDPILVRQAWLGTLIILVLIAGISSVTVVPWILSGC